MFIGFYGRETWCAVSSLTLCTARHLAVRNTIQIDVFGRLSKIFVYCQYAGSIPWPGILITPGCHLPNETFIVQAGIKTAL